MRMILFTLTLGLAPAAFAQERNSDHDVLPETEMSEYVCTAVGSGPLGIRSFEAVGSYTRAYYLALARCQYAHGEGYRSHSMGICRVTHCTTTRF